MKILCTKCNVTKEYDLLALPSGDMGYYRCPNCGVQDRRAKIFIVEK